MKQIVRLTESELKNIVEKAVIRAVNEGAVEEGKVKDFLKSAGKTAAAGVLGGAALTAAAGAGAFDKQMDAQEKVSQADPETKKEFGDKLKPKSERDKKAKKDKKTASWPSNKNVPSMINTEARIHRAVMESLNRLMNDRL